MQTILVCDDDKEIVEAIEIYLQQEGYHILKAYDGEEALEILKENEVHLLIMDVMMPRLDGIRATLKIREESSIPIIILSAKTEDADKILGLNIGADDYVEKPFNPLELVARVKSQLRRYTQLGNAAESSASSTTSFYYWSKIRERYFPLIRSMRASGMRMRSERTIRWQYISATSVKKSRSIRRSRAI